MKKYKNYLRNQKIRRLNPNVRRIVNGKPVTFRDPFSTGVAEGIASNSVSVGK